MTSIAERYRALVSDRSFESDPAQADLVAQARRARRQIEADYKAEAKPSGLSRLFGAKPAEPPRGLYIFGPVGRGKTMLMDMFFDAARRAQTPRAFSRLHGRCACAPSPMAQALKRGEATGDDPIAPVAAELAREAWLLCFDEFSVRDIADAMILGRLFAALSPPASWSSRPRTSRPTTSTRTASIARCSCRSSRSCTSGSRCSRSTRAPITGSRSSSARRLLYAARPECGRRARRRLSR